MEQLGPVVRQAAGYLKSQRSDRFACRLLRILTPLEIAHEKTDHGRTRTVRHACCEGALADARAGLEPEHARAGGIEPLLGRVKQPGPSVKALGLIDDTGLEGAGIEHIPQLLQVATDAGILRVGKYVTDIGHALREPGGPVLSVVAAARAVENLPPVLEVMPL